MKQQKPSLNEKLNKHIRERLKSFMRSQNNIWDIFNQKEYTSQLRQFTTRCTPLVTLKNRKTRFEFAKK